MLKCEKCGTENENGAKFCKSCGTALEIASQETANVINGNSTIQTVKKIVVWIAAIIIGIIAISVSVNYIQVQKREARITELRNGCANNDAKACYELVSSGILFDSDVPPDRNEINEALAKGCRLGNKDACREGGYYEQGCELQDGESCYKLAHRSISPKVMECQLLPDSDGCSSILNKQSEYEKKYYDLACDYGYSQGCMSR